MAASLSFICIKTMGRMVYMCSSTVSNKGHSLLFIYVHNFSTISVIQWSKLFVISLQGLVQECLTEYNTCYFTQTVCGRQYHFTVYSVGEHCNSEISSTVDVRTGMKTLSHIHISCLQQNITCTFVHFLFSYFI